MGANVAGGGRDTTGGKVITLDDARTDAELLALVRRGEVSAYGTLFTRHRAAAMNLAVQLARCPADADELTADAFHRVLARINQGHSPVSQFRAYLLTTLRHIAYDKTRRDRRLELAEDVTEVSGVNTEKISEPFNDTTIAGLERSLTARAFERLPERWRAVLWHVEVEGQTPTEVAPIFGLTANAASALLYRARAGLRTAYLQEHVVIHTGRLACRGIFDQLAAYLRDDLRERARAKVAGHLDECRLCRADLDELRDVNSGIGA
jgi:RNA polymerase sigma factor (sigma-70 family)